MPDQRPDGELCGIVAKTRPTSGYGYGPSNQTTTWHAYDASGKTICGRAPHGNGWHSQRVVPWHIDGNANKEARRTVSCRTCLAKVRERSTRVILWQWEPQPFTRTRQPR